MTSEKQTPEREFGLILRLMHLRSYLQEFPTSAYDLAFHFYKEYSNLKLKYLDLANDYKRLRKDFDNLQQENIRLKAAKTNQDVSLPPCISNRGKS